MFKWFAKKREVVDVEDIETKMQVPLGKYAQAIQLAKLLIERLEKENKDLKAELKKYKEKLKNKEKKDV